MALLYVSAGTELNASGERSPTAARSQRWWPWIRPAANCCLPFSVMELIVTLKPTTEASGASSPVTNTAAGCEEELEDEVDVPLPTCPQHGEREQKYSPKQSFHSRLPVKEICEVFGGSNCFTMMETRGSVGMSRNLSSGYRINYRSGKAAMW